MNETIKQAISESFRGETEALIEQLNIASVKGTGEPNAPFGKAVQQSLAHMLELADGLGLATRNLDGYAGIVEYGEGEQTLGILCHLDVVPAGEGWTVPPFGGELHGDRIFGRGAMDDKGPSIAALYALAAIKEAGIPMRRRVKLIFGCDEESGWGCMEHYKQVEAMPDIAFSPDAQYPVVYAEKGILHTTWEKKIQSGLRISCGERANVIPGAATAWVKLDKQTVEAALAGFAPENGYALLEEDGKTKLVVFGRGGHAAFPETAENALQRLLLLLAALPLEEETSDVITHLVSCFQLDLYGEHLGLQLQDDSGVLTASPDILIWDEEGVHLTIDIRYPISAPYTHIVAALEDAFSPIGLTLAHQDVTEGHMVDCESELVQTLLQVYRDMTGEDAQPLAIGGGTYARAMPNRAVAFGCERPGQESLAHMANEFITLEDLRFHTDMIAAAIEALAGAKEE